MNKSEFLEVRQKVIDAGFIKEIEWCRTMQPCDNSSTFLNETVWVILNSGMKNQIARKIWDKIQLAWEHGYATSAAFGHKGKVKAIDFVRENNDKLFQEYLNSANKLEYLKSIPFIGDITKYHLAKNLGHDCAKPDRHLERIAARFKTTTELLCKKLSDETGERIATVDYILWRACNLGIIIN